jgi:hypothetical protein
MKPLKSVALAVVFLILATTVSSVSAQGPLLKEVYFTINSPFEMGNSNVVLPAGTYILHQVSGNDLNLFALYKDNRMHSPLAMVRTARIDYQGTRYPGKTRMLMNMDEEATPTGAIPVINGWNIPGDDGWEIITMVANHERLATVGSDLSRMKHKRGRVVVTVTTNGF